MIIRTTLTVAVRYMVVCVIATEYVRAMDRGSTRIYSIVALACRIRGTTDAVDPKMGTNVAPVCTCSVTFDLNANGCSTTNFPIVAFDRTLSLHPETLRVPICAMTVNNQILS